MTRVTRALVAREADKIFANSPAFNAGLPMAGRQTALRKLQEIVAGETASRVVRVSDLLGAGKTFFLQTGLQHLTRSGLINEERESLFADYRELQRSDALGVPDVKLLIVDELDRKAGRDDILRAVETAARWHHDERVVVLTGDFTLKSEELLSVIEAPEPLELEPLDETLFVRALTARLDKALRQLGAHPDIDAEAKAAAASLFDPSLLECLLPRTDPPIGTFREALGIAQKLASVLPVDDEPCTFTPELAVKLAASDSRRRRPVAQTEFVEALHAEIRARQRSGEPWPAMHAHEFPWLEGISEGGALELETKVIDPLIRAKILLPMGIPYAPPSGRRTPGPYLPTGRTFLAARLGDGVNGR